jgi:hypothetical protein
MLMRTGRGRGFPFVPRPARTGPTDKRAFMARRPSRGNPRASSDSAATVTVDDIRDALIGVIGQILDRYHPTGGEERLAVIGRQRAMNRPLPSAAVDSIWCVLEWLRLCGVYPSWATAEIFDALKRGVRASEVLPCLAKLKDWVADAELKTPVCIPDHLLSFLVTASAANRTKDGPQPSGKFRWKGTDHHMRPLFSRTLEFMWHRESAEESEWMEHVWSRDANETSLKTHVSELNKALVDAGCNRSLHRSGGKIFWDDPKS